MLKTVWKEPQRPKFSFIITAEKKKNGKTPKRKPVGTQPSDKKPEEISKRPDTALTNQGLQVAGGKMANFLQIRNGTENLGKPGQMDLN